MSRPMKHSGVEWLGQIPADWSTNMIFQLFTSVKNKNSDLQEQNLLSLSYGKIKRKNIDTTEGLLPESFDGYNIIEADDIVLRLTDLQNDHKSWRVGLSEERGIITSAYLTIRNRSESLAKYLYYCLHSFDIIKGFYGMGAGVRQSLNWDEIKRLKIILPPIDEQQRIANFLDDKCSRIDSVIANTRATVAEYKKLKQAIITRAVIKGIRANRTLKQSGIEWLGDIPADWHVINIRKIFSFGKGLTITKEDLRESGQPVVSYGQIHSKFNSGTTLTPELIRFVDNDYLQSNPQSLVKRGDFIFADTSEDLAGCGNCVYVDTDDPIFAGYHTIILRSKTCADLKYFAFLFLSDAWRKQIRERVTGVKLFSISQKILRATSVLVPPIDEQREIAAYLDAKTAAIDSLVAKKIRLIAELESLKKSLIFEYVTGKKEVAQ